MSDPEVLPKIKYPWWESMGTPECKDVFEVNEGAKMTNDELERLAEESFKAGYIVAQSELDKLRAQNQKMRKALERINSWYDSVNLAATCPRCTSPSLSLEFVNMAREALGDL